MGCLVLIHFIQLFAITAPLQHWKKGDADLFNPLNHLNTFLLFLRACPLVYSTDIFIEQEITRNLSS